MNNLNLWEELNKLKETCKWVDLSHEVSSDTPHWHGFGSLKSSTLYDIEKDGFTTHTYEIVGQYGTHVDAPIHFVKGGRTLDTLTPEDMVLPLCVIDKSKEVEKNNDFAVTLQDILEWESVNGKIPAGSFVAFMSNWSKRANQEAMENKDENGVKHYPGWSMEALEFLVKERNVAAIGHEQADTDPAFIAQNEGMIGEYYILSAGKYQIELLKNLDLCPATGAVIFCTFPKIKDGTGFTARCFAICPK